METRAARAALAEVPAQARQIVELAYLDAMGFDEVALRLELVPGEVLARSSPAECARSAKP